MKFLLASLLALQLTGTTDPTELDKLKAENLKLKSQLIQTSQQLTELRFQLETNNFVEEMRVKLKAGKDDVFNWDTLKFDKKDEKDEKNEVKK